MYRKALSVQERLGHKRNQAGAAGYLSMIYQQRQAHTERERDGAPSRSSCLRK